MEEPLIYTSKGNLPIASLEFKCWWDEDDNQISYHEQYLLNGEVVKQGGAMRLKKGLDATIIGGL